MAIPESVDFDWLTGEEAFNGQQCLLPIEPRSFVHRKECFLKAKRYRMVPKVTELIAKDEAPTAIDSSIYPNPRILAFSAWNLLELEWAWRDTPGTSLTST